MFVSHLSPQNTHSVLCVLCLSHIFDQILKMAGYGPPQYNLDENTKNLLLEKAKRRSELRQEFLKLKTDPFRHASEEGGFVVCVFLVLCHSADYFFGSYSH